jgi:hypothetical protein
VRQLRSTVPLIFWLLAGASLAALALLWPGLCRAAPVPLHMLVGSSAWFVGLVRGLVLLALVIKLAALPVVIAVALAVGGGLRPALLAALALGLLGLGLRALHRARPRSCAAPLRDEGLFFLGCVLVLLAVSPRPGSDLIGIAVGSGLAVVLMAVAGAGLIATWGARPRFVAMRRPDFRVNADNPDAFNLIARIRVRDGLRIIAPHVSEGPVTMAVYDRRLRLVTDLLWSQLRPALESRGEVKIHLGATPAPQPADHEVPLAPGDYFLSLRQYRPRDRSRLPVIEPGEGS